jgi:hypothetical protein
MPIKKTVQSTSKDRMYLLEGRTPPKQFFLRSRHKKGAPLTFYDGKSQRALRYSTNQSSVFEDEQAGEVILEAVVFNNGSLLVPKENSTLQEFLDKHPSNINNGGAVFRLHDPEAEAEQEVKQLETEAEALSAVLSLKVEQIESIALAIWGVTTLTKKTSELKRDLLIYAKESPSDFMHLASDDLTELIGIAHKAEDLGLVRFENGNYYSGERLLFKVPFDVEDKKLSLAKWMRQETEGDAFLKFLKKEFK